MKLTESLSVRRAWIEMNINGPMSKGQVVALRKESVDRNTVFLVLPLFGALSLSVRRAWIEISAVMRQNPGKHCRSP